jgi:hypothetical protein
MSETKSPAEQANMAADVLRDAVRKTEWKLPSETQRENLIAAVKEDLAAGAVYRDETEQRLVKLEAQTEVLADAVIAIAEVPVGVAPTIDAVKAER